MSRRRSSEPVVAFEIHMFSTSERVVGFRYPSSIGRDGKPRSCTNPEPHWKPGPNEVPIASCCFAVIGAGLAFQWPYAHGQEAAERTSEAIPGSVVVPAEWRDDADETRPRILDGAAVSVAVDRASRPAARERAPRAPAAPAPVPQPQQKSLFE